MKWLIKIYIIGFILSLFGNLLVCSPAFSEDASVAANRPATVSIFISRNIRPYIDASDAIRETLKKTVRPDIEVYELYRYGEKARQNLAEQLNEGSAEGLCIAVGPEATAFIWQQIEQGDGWKFYSIVLNPEKVAAVVEPACGVPLNIPPRLQLKYIQKSFPSIRRIGIFYDPAHNDEFFGKASRTAYKLGMVLVPLEVKSKKEIPLLLSDKIPNLDCIWLIPDRTVISESISQYIIKQSVLQAVPVIGYNQFFYDSGAAAAFVFDYAALGRQTAQMALNAMRKNQCHPEVPEFQVWINQPVFEKLGIPLPEPGQPLVMGP